MIEETDQLRQRLLESMVSKNFCSFDPYDGLSGVITPLGWPKVLQRFWVQGIKRGPIWIRHLIGVKKVRMATTAAQVLEAVAVGEMVSERVSPNLLAEMILREQKSDGGWGYEFDATLRWGKYTAQQSNLIATYFCVRALTLANVQGDWKKRARTYLENQFSNSHFRYAGNNETVIHNASTLGALALFFCGGDSLIVQEAISQIKSAQNEDGGWFYGVGKGLDWIDNFHTCYILISLEELQRNGFDVFDTLTLGRNYFSQNFELGDGLKYYSSDKRATKDINTYACALQMFSIQQLNSDKPGTHKEKIEQLIEVLGNLISKDTQMQYSFRWKSAPALLAMNYAHKALGVK